MTAARRWGPALVWLALAAALLLPGCDRQPALVGRWRDESPAALLYDFRADGSVWLPEQGQLPVYRYETDGDSLWLYDGMGRRRELRYALSDDRLTLTDEAGAVYGVYRREKEGG